MRFSYFPGLNKRQVLADYFFRNYLSTDFNFKSIDVEESFRLLEQRTRDRPSNTNLFNLGVLQRELKDFSGAYSSFKDAATHALEGDAYFALACTQIHNGLDGSLYLNKARIYYETSTSARGMVSNSFLPNAEKVEVLLREYDSSFNSQAQFSIEGRKTSNGSEASTSESAFPSLAIMDSFNLVEDFMLREMKYFPLTSKKSGSFLVDLCLPTEFGEHYPNIFITKFESKGFSYEELSELITGLKRQILN